MTPSPQQLELAWRLAGWTMLHYLWIGAAIALAGGALRLACRRAAPNVKYAASLATLAALAAASPAIAAWLSLHSPTILVGRTEIPSTEQIAEQGAPTRDGSAMYAAKAAANVDVPTVQQRPTELRMLSEATAANPSPSPSRRGKGTSSFTSSLEGVVHSLPWLWLVGAPLTFALLAAGLVGSRRLQRACQPIDAGPVHEALIRLRAAMRVTRRVAVALADGVAQPVLIGIVRPIILLPASAVSGWSPEELEMVLLHELAHVRRWDNLVNLVQRVIESLLFFHPVVWLASRQVRRDREECCDAAVLRHTQQPETYASLLVSIASTLRDRRLPPMAVASAMADRALAGRIRRILNLEDEPMWVSRKTLAVLFLSAVAIAVATLFIPPAVLADDESTAATAPSTDATTDPAVAGDPAPPLELPATNEIVSPLPEEVLRSSAARERIVNELARQGFKAVIPNVEGDPDSKVAMTITVPENFRARVVWEEHGEGPVCRVIDLANPAPATEVLASYGTPLAPPTPTIGVEAARMPEGKVYRVVYAVSDVDTVKLQQWMKIIAGDEPIEIKWFDDNKSLVVGATRSGHDRISEFLREARDATDESLKSLLPRLPQAESQELRFAADAEYGEIANLANTLAAAGKQVSIKRNEDGTTTLTAVREIPPTPVDPGQAATNTPVELKFPPTAPFVDVSDAVGRLSSTGQPVTVGASPSTLTADDVVLLRVAGTPPEQPIDSTYRVEEQGTLALGPAYGRVDVAGKTVQEAEQAVEAHLEKILTDVQVQLSLAKPMPAPPKPLQPSYRYDGKSFDEWQSSWKYELKPERRTEAILALSMFARIGNAQEATESILDVAGEYDFRLVGDSTAEGQLTNEIVIVLASANRRIPPSVWLPALAARLKADGPASKNMQSLALALLTELSDDDPAIRPQLISLAEYEPREVADAAIVALVNNDPLLADDKTVQLVKASLSRPAPALHVLRRLSFTLLDKAPEQVELFFHPDATIRGWAIQVLNGIRVSTKSAIATPLLAVLDDANRAADHAVVINTLLNWKQLVDASANDETRMRVKTRFEQVLRDGDKSLVKPALIAVSVLDGQAVEQVFERLVLAGELSPERRQDLAEAVEEIRTKSRSSPIR